MPVTQSYEATDVNHVLTLEEITNLTEEGGKPADTLMNVVALIATRFRTDVCSAYLLEPDRSNLVLAATLGLHPRCIGALRMPLNEGLVGLVAEQVMPVAVEDAGNHPRFKYFRESGEEVYRSFLGVPLIDRGILQCVLVVQTKEPRVFRETEISMLVEAANEVAPVVSAHSGSFHCPGSGTSLVARAESLVVLGPRLYELISRSESHALAGAEPESDLDAQRDASGGNRVSRGGTGFA